MTWYTLAFISALLSAAAAIIEKKALFKIKALEFSLLVSVTGFIFSLPFGFNFTLASFSTLGFYVLLLKTAMNALSFYFIMSALKNLDISNSLPLMELSPGLVAVLGAIFLNEIPNSYQIAGIVMLIIGTYLINLKKINGLMEPVKIFLSSKGHNFILYALLLFTVTSILDKVIVVKLNVTPENFIFLHHLITALIFIITYLIIRKKESIPIIKSIGNDVWILILLVGFLSVFYRYSQILAIKGGHVALVLAIKRTSVFFACVIGGTLFKEETLMQRIAATIILIVGGALIIMF
jgi:drug/metabolite transporter (DMT)-like permease